MFSDFLQPQTIARLGARQYIYSQRFVLGAAASLGGEPSNEGSGSIGIQGGIHFFAESLMAIYRTTFYDGGTLRDDGATRVSLMVSTGKSLPMFQNPVSLAFFPPGRTPEAAVLDALGGVTPPLQALRIPGFPFKSFMFQGSVLNHQFANSSNAPNVVDIAWRGWNIPVENCRDVAEFNDIVMNCQLPPAVA